MVSWRGRDASTARGGSLRSPRRFALHDKSFYQFCTRRGLGVDASRVRVTELGSCGSECVVDLSDQGSIREIFNLRAQPAIWGEVSGETQLQIVVG